MGWVDCQPTLVRVPAHAWLPTHAHNSCSCQGCASATFLDSPEPWPSPHALQEMIEASMGGKLDPTQPLINLDNDLDKVQVFLE